MSSWRCQLEESFPIPEISAVDYVVNFLTGNTTSNSYKKIREALQLGKPMGEFTLVL